MIRFLSVISTAVYLENHGGSLELSLESEFILDGSFIIEKLHKNGHNCPRFRFYNTLDVTRSSIQWLNADTVRKITFQHRSSRLVEYFHGPLLGSPILSIDFALYKYNIDSIFWRIIVVRRSGMVNGRFSFSLFAILCVHARQRSVWAIGSH